MERLNTIQKREKLNEVFAVDEKGPGGANHEYGIYRDEIICSNSITTEHEMNLISKIQFQKGARNEVKSQQGVIDTDLLEIVRDRLHCFQQGEFASEYNYQALIHIEEALMWLNRRVEDRIERNVLGTYNK
ncbi:TPA: ABC transporter ATPase [Clostridium perfringens]|uniref:ABC transporter ATPase n=1 Tax=Clostridium perfringens TaxID=1502 RepID=UPI000D713D28|nr:ABC transporter ATPase [Clostridium perfringens]EGT4142423.1 ABC transporter ATPase [Clostridium perfringens]MBO3408013.1 ABC transporter ATPase [Clostridium perfringens]MBO3430513.1 ABC transporter ATPase [Clostridium perfringens]MDK0802780.1 ABC transporter ATPase [Clostridium perfringens]MDM0719988.1 ABC transporter ATPase [Clostridium perfringens]